MTKLVNGDNLFNKHIEEHGDKYKFVVATLTQVINPEVGAFGSLTQKI